MIKTVKQAIRVIRTKTGLSRDEIAGRINRNPSYLSSAQKRPTSQIIDLLKEEFATELDGITIVLDDKPDIVILDSKQTNIKMNSLEVQAVVNVLLPVIAETYSKQEELEFQKVFDALRIKLEGEIHRLKESSTKHG